jgi:hypothetical protein
MTTVSPTAVYVTYPLATLSTDTDAVERAVAGVMPPNAVERTGDHVGITVYPTADGVAWEPVTDARPVGVWFDTGDASVRVSTEIDGPTVPAVLEEVCEVVCDALDERVGDDPPTYAFDLAAPTPVRDVLADDHVGTRSTSFGGESPDRVSYEYDGVSYRVVGDDRVVLQGGYDDPETALAALTAHLSARAETATAGAFDLTIEATHLVFELAGRVDVSAVAEQFGDRIPVTDRSVHGQGFQAMLAAGLGTDGSVQLFAERPSANTVEVQLRVQPSANQVAVSSPSADWETLAAVLDQVAHITGLPVGDLRTLNHQVVGRGEDFVDVVQGLPEERIVDTQHGHGGETAVTYVLDGTRFRIDTAGMVTPLVEDIDGAREATDDLLTHLDETGLA